MGFEALGAFVGDALFGGAADVIGGSLLGDVAGGLGLDALAGGVGAGIGDAAASWAVGDVAGGIGLGSIASGVKGVADIVGAGSDIVKGVGGLAGANNLANPQKPHVDPIAGAGTVWGNPIPYQQPTTGSSVLIPQDFGHVTASQAPAVGAVATGQRPGDMSIQELMDRTDPFVHQRETYGKLLDQLWNDPSQLEKSPGYQAGLQAVQRSEAAQGYGSSGHLANSLLQYGGSIFDKQINTLAALADVAPGSAVAAGQLGANYQLDQQHQAQSAAQAAANLNAQAAQAAAAQQTMASMHEQDLKAAQEQQRLQLEQQNQQFNATQAQQLAEFNQNIFQQAQLANQSIQQQTQTTNAQIQSQLGISGAQIQQVGSTNATQLVGQSLNSLASGISGLGKYF